MIPKISIIIPVYNGETFIKNCIESVLSQTLNEIQVIVVDDGSIDKTYEILKSFAVEDTRIELIRQKNSGVGNARNKGLEAAKGDWIVFVDSDDMIKSEYCAELLEAANLLKTDVLISYSNFNRDKEITLFERKKELILACISFDETMHEFNVDAPWGKIFRNSVIKKYKIRFPEHLTRSEDALFCATFYDKATTIGVINRCGYLHEKREGSLCRSFAPGSRKMLECILLANRQWLEERNYLSKEYKNALWYRVLPGIVECEHAYFLHGENQNSVFRNLIEYQQFLNKNYIRMAIKNLRIKDIKNRQLMIRTIFYKYYLGWFFILIKKLKKIVIKTHLFNLVTARWHHTKRRKEIAVLFGNKLDKYKTMPMEVKAEKISNYVWVCWWQGEQDMSPIVKSCYERIKKYNFEKKIVLITEENLEEYVIFPQYIMDKYESGIITRTHFSDILRTELLYRYGGVWMDITIMTHSSIPDEFYEFPIYTGKFIYNKYDYNISKNRWLSYFWVSRYPENILFKYLSEFWKIYWKEYSGLIEYFLIDYAIDWAYKNISQIKKEIDAVPINGCGENVWQLLKILDKEYDEELLGDIITKNWMQKLSYKGEEKIQEKAMNPNKSIYKKIFLEN